MTKTSVPLVHIKVWSGSGSARITDMANAGKRGKACRVLRFLGAPWSHSTTLSPSAKAAYDATVHIMATLETFSTAETFDAVRAWVLAEVDKAKAAGSGDYVNAYDETIKGIKAPRPVLSAGVEGQWSATANETGLHLQKNDVNLWSEITPSSQSPVRAYEIAAKVWPRVMAATTMREASDILSTAGARLHGYCAMD